MREVVEAYVGAWRRVQVTLAEGSYTLATGLEAQCWPGDDRAALFNPAADWVDPALRTLTLEFAPADTATLAPGLYPVRLGVTTAEGTAWIPALTLKLLAAPGTAVERPVYCAYDDLRRYAGAWLDALSVSETYQAGAAEERAEAREALDDLILGKSTGLGQRAGWLAEQLDDDRLIVSEPIRRWNVLWALAIICRRQITAKGENAYEALADRYRGEAEALLPTIVAEIDTDGDGVGDVVIPMGTLRVYRG